MASCGVGTDPYAGYLSGSGRRGACGAPKCPPLQNGKAIKTENQNIDTKPSEPASVKAEQCKRHRCAVLKTLPRKGSGGEASKRDFEAKLEIYLRTISHSSMHTSIWIVNNKREWTATSCSACCERSCALRTSSRHEFCCKITMTCAERCVCVRDACDISDRDSRYFFSQWVTRAIVSA